MRPTLPGPPVPPQPPDAASASSPRLGESLSGRWAGISRAALAAAWVAVAAIHLALPPGVRIRTWPLGYLLLEVLAGASLAFRAWKAKEGRLAWGLLAASALLEVPNLLLTALLLRGLAPAGLAGLPSLLSLATGILALAGVLVFPLGREPAGMLRRGLDGLIFAASLLFLLWVMGVQGSLRSAEAGMGLRVFAAFLNAALLGGGLVYKTSHHPDLLRGPLGWLAGSALAWLAALSCWTMAGLPAVVAPQGWTLLAGGIPLFQGFAAWSRRPAAVPADAGGGLWTLARLFPYVAVLGALGVVAALLLGNQLQVMRGAFAIFLAMVALLLLRQFLAIQDLQAARRTLEARVHQRTEALERAQDTVLRTERMNTLALMGAGLAHDLNNLLGAVKNSAEVAVMTLEAGRPVEAKDLHRVNLAADRAVTLTRRLMGFARRDREDLGPVDLGREVADLETTLRLLLPGPAELQMEVAPAGALVVKSSSLRLEQMLVNLVANAGDAMPGGGSLLIRVDRGGDGQAVLEVADSGTGMAPEILERIFDPFFTTKPPGKGTGLGLPSLKAMVEADGGRLEVQSEPGRGSRFRIFLPLVAAAGFSPR